MLKAEKDKDECVIRNEEKLEVRKVFYEEEFKQEYGDTQQGRKYRGNKKIKQHNIKVKKTVTLKTTRLENEADKYQQTKNGRKIELFI